MSDKRTEVKDFVLRAYRTVSLGDQRYQNWRSASTVELLLVVEIDGIEIPVAQHMLAHGEWERAVKRFGKVPDEEKGAA
jgi:hypothetical protein